VAIAAVVRAAAAVVGRAVRVGKIDQTLAHAEDAEITGMHHKYKGRPEHRPPFFCRALILNLLRRGRSMKP